MDAQRIIKNCLNLLFILSTIWPSFNIEVAFRIFTVELILRYQKTVHDTFVY